MKRRIGMLLTALACAVGLAVTASAANLPAPDLDRTGEITVTASYEKKGESRPLQGVEFTVYRVADAALEDGGLVFRPAPGLEDWEEEMNGRLTASSSKRLARELASSGKLKELASAGPKTTDEEGKATFSGLELGMYLVKQTGGGRGYETIKPFLVTLPQADGDKWDYTVEAAPKTEPGKPDKPDKPDPEEPEEPEEPELPQEPEEPELPQEPEEPEVPEVPQEPEGPKLPQTGLLRWPVFALAVGGLLTFSAGWVMERGRKDDEA